MKYFTSTNMIYWASSYVINIFINLNDDFLVNIKKKKKYITQQIYKYIWIYK